MLIFTHIGNLGKYDTKYKINIARKPVKGFDQFITLAPSKELFYYYLNNRSNPKWFETYKIRFNTELADMEHLLDELCIMSKKHDIVLFCFCRNFKECHRYLEYLYCKDKCECLIE